MIMKSDTFLPKLRKGSGSALAFLSLLFFLLVFSTTALAQQADEISVKGLGVAAGDKSNDASRAIFSSLLKTFADNPLKAFDTPDSLLGHVFFIFNVALFVIGVAFMSYTVIVSIAVSAHEGEVMGKRMSSLWVPIRYGMGVIGMIPAFGGFSLAQALMMFFAVLGIGLANLMTSTAIGLGSDLTNLIPSPSLVGSGDTMYESVTPEIGKQLFLMNVCASAANTHKNWLGRLLDAEVKVDDNGAFVKNISFNCGSVRIIDETGRWSNTLRLGGVDTDGSEGVIGKVIDGASQVVSNPISIFQGHLGFRNNAVDYKLIGEIATASASAKLPILTELNNDMNRLANNWYTAFAKGEAAPYPEDEINQAVASRLDQHDEIVKEKIGSVDKQLSSVKEKAIGEMVKGGWMGLGSWYSTFAEMSSALQSAAAASHFKVQPPSLGSSNLDDSTKRTLISLYTEEKVKSDQGACFGSFGLVDKNATGNCSPFQNAFLFSVGVLIEDTGGEGLVNPIIAVKNIGDWMLTFVATVAGTAIFAKLFEKFTPAGKVGKIAGAGFDFMSGGGSEEGGEGASKIGGLILTMSVILGLTFAVYIPFVPFLTWFSASVSYFASVLEGLVAAQVWAFSHLHTEGEGMGQKAERGYLFIINMLLRPALMVLGFFFASGLLVGLGTFFFSQFGTALANSQGNTITGPFIMMGLIIVIGLALLTLIQTIFNLIYEIPDRVISWFGGGMEAKMAQNMDKGIETGAKTAANWTGGTAMGTVLTGAMGGGGRK